MITLRALWWSALLCVWYATPGAAEDSDPLIEAIREQTDALTSGAAAGQLHAPGLVASLYELNGFRLVWDAKRTERLLQLLRNSGADGLTPSDYHLAQLEVLAQAGTRQPVEAAQFDVLATDAYAQLLSHLYFGKVDPVSLDSQWNFERRSIDGVDVGQFLLKAITADDVESAVVQLRPGHWLYRSAMDALADYRRIAAQGGWPQVAAGGSLKIGDVGPRVDALRARLRASTDGALPAEPGVPYDADLEAALKHFQARHLLTPDGVMGPATLSELNVSVAQRIDQIRVNLERGRWVLHHLGSEEDLVIVDVAGFEVRYMRNGKTLLRARAQIGTPYRRTPIFRSAIDHVVLNPTWTVPPGILGKDILPALRRDPGYLNKRGLRVIDRAGKPVAAASIDFTRYTGVNFPYMIRQDPGPTNALGRVKIMFPNSYLVYLHDTPSKEQFSRDRRAFSSGCVRIERPFELVEQLLSGSWDKARLDAAVATGSTRTIRLPKPVPVLMLYWSIDRDANGNLVFKSDPYNRDGMVRVALDRPFMPHR